MTPIGDAELVQRCRRRDAEAFGELVERHQRLVFGVALARCRDAALAEDLAQEAFVTAWRDLDRLRDDARIGSWVAGIARNLASSAARDRVRRAEPPPLDVASPPTPEDAALEREDRELLARALADVPRTHREALVLYYLEGESIARIAEALGINEDLVKQRLSRGRRALREGLASRVEAALYRVRAKPALRAGVIAALVPAAARKATAASTAGKVFAMFTLKKLAIGAIVLALASGAIYLGTRGHGEPARANAAAPGPAAPQPAAASKSHVRRIDPAKRQDLLDAIHSAHTRAPAAPALPSEPGAASPSGKTARPELPPDGDLDKAYIRASVQDLIPMLVDCYDKALNQNPRLAGTVVVKFTIEGEPGIGGVVSESEIDKIKSTLPDPKVRECIQDTMYSLEIDPPANGGQVSVVYPFLFAPSHDEIPPDDQPPASR